MGINYKIIGKKIRLARKYRGCPKRSLQKRPSVTRTR